MAAIHSTVTYRPIKGFSDYRVGSDGTVWSKKRGEWKILKQSIKKGENYRRVNLSQKGKITKASVHCLICIAFNGSKPFRSAQCRHIDGDPSNNVPHNLAWGTAKQNAEDRTSHGRTHKPKGEMSPMHKITEKLATEMLKRIYAGEIRQAAACKEYHLSPAQVSRICNGQRWGHLCQIFNNDKAVRL